MSENSQILPKLKQTLGRRRKINRGKRNSQKQARKLLIRYPKILERFPLTLKMKLQDFQFRLPCLNVSALAVNKKNADRLIYNVHVDSREMRLLENYFLRYRLCSSICTKFNRTGSCDICYF